MCGVGVVGSCLKVIIINIIIVLWCGKCGYGVDSYHEVSNNSCVVLGGCCLWIGCCYVVWCVVWLMGWYWFWFLIWKYTLVLWWVVYGSSVTLLVVMLCWSWCGWLTC